MFMNIGGLIVMSLFMLEKGEEAVLI